LRLAIQLLLAERRQGHAEKADAFGDRDFNLKPVSVVVFDDTPYKIAVDRILSQSC
jgi:hypothetical protein